MRHAIFAACGAFTLAGTMTLVAQTPPQAPRPSSPTPTPTRTDTDDRTITVTGCLKAWDSTMTGPATGAATPGAANGSGSAAMAGKFVLTNVQGNAARMPGDTAAKPDSTTATGAAHTGDAKSDDTKQYVLTADSGVNLKAHVNHQVRVTGKTTAMADHSAMGATRQDEATRQGEATRPGETTEPRTTQDHGRTTTDRDHMGKAWPTITVSSVTMISATCTGTTR